MKRAFTLIELLVVIGIIAILAAVLLGTFAGSTESAQAARCLTNMKNIANAVQSYGMQTGYYPPAASGEYTKIDVSSGLAQAKLKYYETPGWISWYSAGLYPSESSKASSCRTIGLYSEVVDDYRYALSHGSLYAQLSGNDSVYVCPTHLSKNPHAHWSYFMNPKSGGHEYGKFKNADRVLLLGEIPFQGPGEWFPSGSAGNEETDAVIQYEKENIGANHKSGKLLVAHVVFADGHVEKLRVSGTKGRVMSGSELRELTEWLCEGEDVSFNGSAYEKLTE